MIQKDNSIKQLLSWKKEYTVVLILNVLYVMLFYFIMTIYS